MVSILEIQNFHEITTKTPLSAIFCVIFITAINSNIDLEQTVKRSAQN